MNAPVPHDYVENERLRLEVYRKIAEVRTDQLAAVVREELIDRYGPVPIEVENLLSVAKLRTAAKAVGVTEISTQGKQIRFSPMVLSDSIQMRLDRVYKGAHYKPALSLVSIPRPTDGAGVASPPLRNQAIIDWASRVLDDLVPVPASAAAS